MSVDALVVGIHALSVIAALLAAGTTIFATLLHEQIGDVGPSIRTLAIHLAVVAVVLTIAQQLAAPARLAGAFSGIADWSLHKTWLSSDAGAAATVRLLGLAAIAVGARGHERGPGVTVVIGAALVAASFGFVGHTAHHPVRWLLAPLLIAHVLIVAFWFGALAPLAVAAKRLPAAAAAALIARFSSLAIIAVPFILIAGLTMAALLVPDLAGLSRPYGRLLIAKVIGFFLLMLLAAINKLRFGPAIARGRRNARLEFTRTVIAEWIMIAVVISVTVAMTTSYSPEH
jgi:putative copper export protein